MLALSATMGIGVAALRGPRTGPARYYAPTGAEPITRSLETGRRIGAIVENMMTSLRNRAGDSIRAAVRGDVKDSNGNVVIPAASTLILTVVEMESGTSDARPNGRLRLATSSVTVNGRVYPLVARLEPVPHRFQGRSTRRPEAVDESAGTTMPAFRYAYHDVIVPAGTRIVFTLTRPFRVAAK